MWTWRDRGPERTEEASAERLGARTKRPAFGLDTPRLDQVAIQIPPAFGNSRPSRGWDPALPRQRA